MAERSNIEWTDSTFNPWLGCTKISPACDHCYAEALIDTRLHQARWGAGQPRVRTSPANWKKPLKWNREPFAGCNECGWRGVPIKGETGYQCAACRHVNLAPQRRRVFCASLADVFDNAVDPQWRVALWNLIASTPHLDWLLLTKRIGNVPAMLPDDRIGARYSWGSGWSNVWIGATICNQSEADRDIPKLLALPAAVRFLSIEPMLGAIDLKFLQYEDSEERDELGRIIANTRRRLLKWVIAGGESGPHARPSHPDWFRSLRDQCVVAGVPFLFKQWGEYRHREQVEDTRGDVAGSILYVPEHRASYARVGRKAAGRLLDGRTQDGFPESQA